MSRARWVVPGVLLVLLALVVITGTLRGVDPTAQNVDIRLTPPSAGAPMGTDGFGRDVHSRVAVGLRYSLTIAALSLVFAATIGIPAGALAALRGGRAEYLVLRAADLFLAIPSFLVALIVVIVVGTSPVAIAAALAVGFAPRLARTSWAAVGTVRDEEYVLAARSLGVGPLRILRRHILPTLLGTLSAQLASLAGAAVGTEAALSFLGLGVPPPTPSLGRMLLEGSRQYFEAAPWVTIFPGATLAITGIALVLVSRALDPGNPAN